jgi:hypothetical protein
MTEQGLTECRINIELLYRDRRQPVLLQCAVGFRKRSLCYGTMVSRAHVTLYMSFVR